MEAVYAALGSLKRLMAALRSRKALSGGNQRSAALGSLERDYLALVRQPMCRALGSLNATLSAYAACAD